MDKRSKKPLTAKEQLEVELQLEQDVARLQRKCQIMERDRTAFSEATGSKLAKQLKVISILKKEQRNLLIDLNVATSDLKKKEDERVTNQLQELLEEHHSFEDKVKLERSYLKEIDYQINKVEKDVYNLRSKQITDQQCQARVLAGQKAVEGLENRLDTEIKKFCLILADNRVLREDIHHLLNERAHFNVMWEKLIGNLNQGKKFMLDLIEQATIAYDQREEWCSKLQALRVRAHHDLLMHTEEMRELHRKMDHDRKLQDFLGVKEQKRLMRDLEEKKMKKRELEREQMEEKIANYRQMLYNIKEFTEENDFHTISRQFIKQEEDNFSLFNYVVVLNREIEELNEKVLKLHINIDEQSALNERRKQQQADTLEDLQTYLQKETDQADQAQEELNATENELTQLLSDIEKIFTMCKCSNAPFLELLGNNAQINKYNVLLYLEMLEKRVNELIMNVFYKQKIDKKKPNSEGIIKDDKIKYKLQVIENIVAVNPCPLCVEQEQVSDVIDTLQFVLTKDGVQEKLKLRLAIGDPTDRLHNVSACHLPKSRRIIQRRYQ